LGQCALCVVEWSDKQRCMSWTLSHPRFAILIRLRGGLMNNIIYIVGLVVVIAVVLSFLGFA